MTSDEAMAATAGARGTARTSARRAGSGVPAKVLTGLFALLATPVGVLLLTWGSMPWRRAVSQAYAGQSPFDLIPPGAMAQLLAGTGIGIILLLAVAASGILSSAGPLVGALWGVIPVVLGAVPMLMVTGYEVLGWSWMTLPVLEALSLGHGLVIPPLLGGIGISLALARRRPSPPVAASLLGLVLVPLLLGGALVLTLQGHARGLAWTLMTLDAPARMLPTLLLLAGVLLLVLAPALAAWSPYAGVLPALALLALSVGSAVRPDLVFSLLFGAGPEASLIATFLFSGGSALVALLLLAHAAALLVVRRRSLRR